MAILQGILGLCLVLATVQAECNKKTIAAMNNCIEKGFDSTLECDAGEYSLTNTKEKMCRNHVEPKAIACGYECPDKAEPDNRFLVINLEHDKQCVSILSIYEDCLRRDYVSGIGCKNSGWDLDQVFAPLNAKGRAKCAETEPKLDKCNYKCGKSNCKRSEVYFAGDDMKEITSNSIEQCARECRKIEGCMAVSYMKSKNTCWLKDTKGGSEGSRPDPTYNSMNMNCLYPNPDKACNNKGYNSNAKELASFELTKFDDCLKHCQESGNCTGISFTPGTCVLRSETNKGKLVEASGWETMDMTC